MAGMCALSFYHSCLMLLGGGYFQWDICQGREPVSKKIFIDISKYQEIAKNQCHFKFMIFPTSRRLPRSAKWCLNGWRYIYLFWHVLMSFTSQFPTWHKKNSTSHVFRTNLTGWQRATMIILTLLGPITICTGKPKDIQQEDRIDFFKDPDPISN